MIKILIGGSPCTKWSIAQKNGRETEPSGEGWELFSNYSIAKQKFNPDFFLYENNKSAAQAIKDQISKELGVKLMHINSSLVSAQNRQRFYAFNWEVEQPEDRGILLKDILEGGTIDREKAYCLKHQAGNTRDYFKKHHTQIRVGALPRPNGELSTSEGMRIYNTEGKGRVLLANGGGQGAKTGLYAIPIEFEDGITTKAISCTDGKTYTVYEVKDGFITIKGKQYPIKLADGYYIIRKLTVKECCRLQTMPDDYFLDENGEKIISDSQAYKCLGNGWTAEVIIHILQGALKDIPKDEEIIVLSMYDGIATGRYCLDKMGFTNIKYYAYEIDEYAKKVAMANYPDIIQCGDAFAVREEGWRLEI